MGFAGGVGCLKIGGGSGVCGVSETTYVIYPPHAQDTSVADHLHYLGVSFGAADMEGQIAKVNMQTLGLEEEAVEVAGGGGVVPVVEA
jgi:hypothetical protein